MNNQFKGWHHYYMGLILCLLGFPLIWYIPIFAGLLILLGLICIIDDAYQHIRQQWQPEYLSPLHTFYGKYLWKLEWVQRLNKWFDNLLGK